MEMIQDFQQTFGDALTEGLQFKLGPVTGGLLSDVVGYYPGIPLPPGELKRLVDSDAAAALNAIMTNRRDETTFRLIRGQMIGHALLADEPAVVRWATELRNRCPQTGAAQRAVTAQLDWVIQNPSRYILYARRLKHFLHQVD